VEGLPEVVRLFVAIDLPAAHRERLAGYLAACQEVAPHYRWVPAENLHLTLRFIGNVRVETVDPIRSSLAEVGRRPFRMRLGGLGEFGSPSRPRVVWIGVEEGRDAAAELATEVEAACRRAGLPPTDLPFRPHLTLARAGKTGGRLPQLPDTPRLDPWQVRGFTLYRTRLGRPHPRYIPLERFQDVQDARD
jgi:RNA 2',3'-cyclic 3'-phosphodiesterase